MMKFNHLCFSLLLSLSTSFAQHDHDGEMACTHGKLFVSEDGTSNVYVFDVAEGDLGNLAHEEDPVEAPGGGSVTLAITDSGKEVAMIYRGTAENNYTDGTVGFMDTGVDAEDHGDHNDVTYKAISMVTNAAFDCARAIHYVLHDNMIAIFCDGSYGTGTDPQVNTTVWVLDESKFGSTPESAIVFQTTIQGSHHGVAIPIDENHVLHSLATEDRVNKTPEGEEQALPVAFQVVNFQGELVQSIDKERPRFHGSAAQRNNFALACQDSILLLQYDAATESYATLKLNYPDGFADHRTFGFAEHPKASFVVGNFGGGDKNNLVAFSLVDDELTLNQVQTFSARPCAFAFEHGQGELVLVLMPEGMLHAFEYEDEAWKEVAKIQTAPMTECSEAVFTPGVGHAFVLRKGSTKNTLFAVDLERVHHDGEMEVSSSDIPFTPYDAVVSGVPLEAACAMDEDDHDHDHDHGHECNVITWILQILFGWNLGFLFNFEFCDL